MLEKSKAGPRGKLIENKVFGSKDYSVLVRRVLMFIIIIIIIIKICLISIFINIIIFIKI